MTIEEPLFSLPAANRTFRTRPVWRASDQKVERERLNPPFSRACRKWLPGVERGEYWFLEGPRPEDGRLSDGPNKKTQIREQARQARGPSLREKAVALALEKGTVRTKDMEAIGVPRHYPAMMCVEGLLERIGYGLYRAVDKEAQDAAETLIEVGCPVPKHAR